MTKCEERQARLEGACLPLFANRSHLPLRGKLGWMTPRAGVKTTPAIETRLLGPPIPSGGPSFFSARQKKSWVDSGSGSLPSECSRGIASPAIQGLEYND